MVDPELQICKIKHIRRRQRLLLKLNQGGNAVKVRDTLLQEWIRRLCQDTDF